MALGDTRGLGGALLNGQEAQNQPSPPLAIQRQIKLRCMVLCVWAPIPMMDL